MDTGLLQLFLNEVSKHLSFLTDYGFQGPAVEVDDRLHFGYATFRGKHLAIEFALDEREGDVTCEVTRPDQKPGDVRRSDGSRKYLSEILRKNGSKFGFTPVGALTLAERVPLILRDYGRVLREHGADILADSPSVLE